MNYHISIRQTGNSYYVFMPYFPRTEYIELQYFWQKINQSINDFATVALKITVLCSRHSVDFPVWQQKL